jgi:hypothetical protein
MVQQMVSGDIGAMRSDVKVNNFVGGAKTTDRTNNFMNGPDKATEKRNEPLPKAPEPSFKKPAQSNSNSNINISNVDSSLNSNSNYNPASSSVPKVDSNDTSSIPIDISKEVSKTE